MGKRKFKFIDLFAGAGGLSLGLENAGFELIFANEINKTCAETYLYNRQFPKERFFTGDIRDLNTHFDIVRKISMNKMLNSINHPYF